jgi:hypothetical protein
MGLFTSLGKSNLGMTSSYAAQQRSNKAVENTWESGQNRKDKQSCVLSVGKTVMPVRQSR